MCMCACAHARVYPQTFPNILLRSLSADLTCSMRLLSGKGLLPSFPPALVTTTSPLPYGRQAGRGARREASISSHKFWL
eukprot:771248-Pelagomonas_calceolata.AAC.1